MPTRSRPIHPHVLYFGTPVALISTLRPDGSVNLSPMSSVWALDDRLVLGLGTDGQGLIDLERTGQCVVNLPEPELWQHVERLARTTARSPVPEWKASMGYQYEADKFARAGLTPSPSETVAPPRVAECPLQLEAQWLKSHLPTGDAPGFAIVEVRVTRVHAHVDLIDSSEHIVPERWRPLLYLFRRYVAGGALLGKNFRAE